MSFKKKGFREEAFPEKVGDENDREQLDVTSKGQKLRKLTKIMALTQKRKGRLPLVKSNDIPRDDRELKRVTLQEMGLPENSKAMDVLNPENKVSRAKDSLLNPLNKKKNKMKSLLRL